MYVLNIFLTYKFVFPFNSFLPLVLLLYTLFRVIAYIIVLFYSNLNIRLYIFCVCSMGRATTAFHCAILYCMMIIKLDLKCRNCFFWIVE